MFKMLTANNPLPCSKVSSSIKTINERSDLARATTTILPSVTHHEDLSPSGGLINCHTNLLHGERRRNPLMGVGQANAKDACGLMVTG